jgi:SeqA protein C-terminal domain
MATPSPVTHIYGEFVHSPYFCLVHSHPRSGHERFDKYKPGALTELMLSVVEHLSAGRPDLLKKMCVLDAEDKERVPGRTRRYLAESEDELYEGGRRDLGSIKYKGYWFSTNAKSVQTRQVVQLACRAIEVPYSSIRKLKGFAADA